MSNILYLDDFKTFTLNVSLPIETRFFEHKSANNNSVDIDKIYELNELVNDLTPVINRYVDQLHAITDVDELIDILQRIFVFLNTEIKYD